jgi:hypothetical protein
MVLTARKGGGGGFIVLLGLTLGLASAECAGPEHFNGGDAGGIGSPGAAGLGVAGAGDAGDTSVAGAGGNGSLAGTGADASATGAAGAVGAAGMGAAGAGLAGAGAAGAGAAGAGAAGAGVAGAGAAGAGTAGAGAAGAGVAGAGVAGAGAAGAGAAGTGAAGASAVNSCLNTSWTFTPEFVCDTANCPSVPASAKDPANAIDGVATTRYTDGRTQAGGEYIILSFGGAVKISGINLLTTSAGDGAKSYQAQYSTDGTTFVAFAPPIAGTGADNLTISFPATVMTAIKITQTGAVVAPATSWWSINEITLVGCVDQ